MTKQNFKTAYSSYDGVGVIGEGGSGRVYKAIDKTGNTFAIKCLDPHKATEEKRKRFKNEIAICEKAIHKNIVPIVDYGIVEIDKAEYPFYVMPYYPKTLRGLMKDGIPHDTVLSLFSNVLDGIEAAHLNFIWHRDIKPENILYSLENNSLLVADFGIAHFHKEFLLTAVETNPKAKLANFQYSAPEQRARGKPVDQRADIFSLGLILNEMFTGEIPQGTDYVLIGKVAPAYEYLDEIVSRMIKQSSNDRFQTIDEIKKKLIANKNEFISRQQLSQLSKKVIPQSELDDPLIHNPIEVIGVDYNNGRLIFTLSSNINSTWKNAFEIQGNFTYIPGVCEPRLFRFELDKAFLSIPEYSKPDQGVVDLFKQYVKNANSKYKEILKRQQREKEIAEERKLQKELEEEKKRQEFLKNLKI